MNYLLDEKKEHQSYNIIMYLFCQINIDKRLQVFCASFINVRSPIKGDEDHDITLVNLGVVCTCCVYDVWYSW